MQHLKDRGIGCEIYYPKPLHLQDCFSDLGYKEGQLPNAEAACRETLAIPIYSELAEKQIDNIAEAIVGFLDSD